MARGYRNTKAFERLTGRMLILVGIGTGANLALLVRLKSSEDWGAPHRAHAGDSARTERRTLPHSQIAVPLEMERAGYERTTKR
jgi:hypothetical protein